MRARNGSNGLRYALDGTMGVTRPSLYRMDELERRMLLSAATRDVIGRLGGADQSASDSNAIDQTTAPSPTDITPAQMRRYYGVDSITFGGTTSIAGDGSGQTIAIVDTYGDPYAYTDLQAFDAYYNLPDPPSFVKLDQDGGTNYPFANPGTTSTFETALDIEWAHVIAPGAKIVLVEATDASFANIYGHAIPTAAAYPGVSVVSLSIGHAEIPGDLQLNASLVPTATNPNITFLAATGDNGAPGWFPAFSPNVVAVGGTTATRLVGDLYGGELGWSGSGGGASVNFAQPGYQVGTVSNAHRTIPDVAMVADDATSAVARDSYLTNGQTPWFSASGTSLACPMMAGLVAIANQGRAHAGMLPLNGATQTLPTLYSMPAADFHDITTGNNGFAAGVGYDLVTGRGTPVANESFVNDLAGVAAAKPVNDDFAGATLLTGYNATATGNSVGASRQTGEPKDVATSGERSIWWKWVAPAGATSVIVNTQDSGFDTTLTAFSGSSLASLNFVASNDDDPTITNLKTSRLTFTATPGTTYYFQVDGYGPTLPNVGSVKISLSSTAPDLKPYQPAGFSDTIVISKVTGTNVDSTGITERDNLYVDAGFINSGTANAGSFAGRLLLDGQVVKAFTDDLDSNVYDQLEDVPLGKLAGGTHTLQLVLDTTNAVGESDETNNSYSRTFSIVSKTDRWTGLANDFNFETPGNWSLGHVPAADEDVVIALSGTYSINAHDPHLLYSLTLGGGGSHPTLFDSADLTLTNASTVNSGATLRLINGTVTGPLTNAGTVLLLGSEHLTTINTVAGSTLEVLGVQGVYGDATITNGFTNNGTIKLANDRSGAYSANLHITNGTLINAGTISSELDGAGDRILDADVDTTAGAIAIESGGQIFVQTGRTMTFGGGTTLSGGGLLSIGNAATLAVAASNFDYQPSTLALSLDKSAALIGPGAFINHATLTLVNNTIAAPIQNMGTLILEGTSVLNGAFTPSAASTLRVLGGHGFYGEATIANGFTNNGTIELTNDLTGAYSANLHVTTGTLTNAGTISSLKAGFGDRNLDANVVSTGGKISIETGGELTVPAGATLTLGSGTTLSGGGTLSVAATGTLAIAAGNFDYQPSTPTISLDSAAILTGPGTFINHATLTLINNTIAAPISNSGTLVLEGTTALNGAFTASAGSIFRVLGGHGFYGNATVANGFTNNGTIELTNDLTGAYSANLNITSGTLTNAGTISSLKAGFGDRNLDANVVSTGGKISIETGGELTVPAGQTLTLGSGTTLSGGGMLSVAANGTLAITAGNFDYQPSTPTISLDSAAILTGPGTFINHATLTLVNNTIAAPISNLGTMVLEGATALNGALTTGVGSTLRVLGGHGFYGNATVANGFTNNGTIDLTNDSTGGYSANLHITTGTLTNAGTISSQQAGAGDRSLDANLNNTGTLTLNYNLLITPHSTALTSSGLIQLAGGDLTVAGATGFNNSGVINFSTPHTITSNVALSNLSGGLLSGSGTIDAGLSNAGTVAPGALSGTDFGTITVTGAYTQTATGTLRITLGGTTASKIDTLIVSSATCSGIFDLHLATGFSPAVGATFHVIVSSNVVAGFGALQGLSYASGVTLAPSPSEADFILAAVANTSTTVINSNESGVGSLRQAVLNATGANPTVTFTQPFGGSGNIALLNSLILNNTISITGLSALTVPISSSTGPVLQIGASGNVTFSQLALSAPSGTALQVDANGRITLHSAALTGAVNAQGSASFDGAQTLTGLTIGANGLVTAAQGSNPYLVTLGSLAVTNGGTLDLANNSLIVRGGSVSSVAALVKSGFNLAGPGAVWAGMGIRSANAAAIAADIDNAHKTTIGYAAAGALGISTFAGSHVDPGDVVLKYTYSGDANLDGAVNALDFNALATNFGKPSPVWSQGDFNYDGVVNTVDLTALAANFGSRNASASAVASAPQPAVSLFGANPIQDGNDAGQGVRSLLTM